MNPQYLLLVELLMNTEVYKIVKSQDNNVIVKIVGSEAIFDQFTAKCFFTLPTVYINLGDLLSLYITIYEDSAMVCPFITIGPIADRPSGHRTYGKLLLLSNPDIICELDAEISTIFGSVSQYYLSSLKYNLKEYLMKCPRHWFYP